MIGTKKPADDHEPIQTKSRYEDPWVMCQECAESIAYRLASRLTVAQPARAVLQALFGFRRAIFVPESSARETLSSSGHVYQSPSNELPSIKLRSQHHLRHYPKPRHFLSLLDKEASYASAFAGIVLGPRLAVWWTNNGKPYVHWSRSCQVANRAATT